MAGAHLPDWFFTFAVEYLDHLSPEITGSLVMQL